MRAAQVVIFILLVLAASECMSPGSATPLLVSKVSGAPHIDRGEAKMQGLQLKQVVDTPVDMDVITDYVFATSIEENENEDQPQTNSFQHGKLNEDFWTHCRGCNFFFVNFFCWTCFQLLVMQNCWSNSWKWKRTPIKDLELLSSNKIVLLSKEVLSIYWE
jgi:hypothetical protein